MEMKDYIADTEAKFAAEAEAAPRPGQVVFSPADIGKSYFIPAPLGPQDNVGRILSLIEKLTESLNHELTRRT